jgi:serine/threonine protein kinase/Tfp pilus assembly protein PilF
LLVEKLLSRWQEGRDKGESPSAADLCRDCPELLPTLQKRIDDLNTGQPAPDDADALLGTFVVPPPGVGDLGGRADVNAASDLTERGVHQQVAGPAAAPAGPPVPPAASGLPRQVGRYLVEEEIGRGGMGAVLRVRDPEFQRPLAVKIILQSAADHPGVVARFLEEGRLTGRLQHPGVPPVHELGRLDNGLPFFAMKLIQGRTLAALLKDRGKKEHLEKPTGGTLRDGGDSPSDSSQGTPSVGFPAPDARLIGIFRQVCQTIGYAHAQGVIHRDLKPSNIMVGAFGEVQVMDWGIAKEIGRLAEEEPVVPRPRAPQAPASSSQPPPSVSQTGEVMGTPAYMPPEQARGAVRELDERADVFGLGGILCEILTGKPPFHGGGTYELLLLSARGDLTTALARLEKCGTDAELVALAKHCLAARKENRPRHAGEVAQAVERYEALVQERLHQAELEGTRARVQAEEERKRHQVERQKKRAILAAAVAGLLLLAGTAGATLWYQNDRAERAAEEAKREADETAAQAKRQAEQAAEKVKRQAEEAERQAKQAAEKAKRDAEEAKRLAEKKSRHKIREQTLGVALNQARRQHDSLHARLDGPGDVFRMLNKAADWREMIVSARADWQRAQDLAASAEDEIAPALRKQLTELGTLLQQDDVDLQLAVRLEKIREARSTLVKGQFQRDLADREYRDAFQKAGLKPRSSQEEAVAALVRRSAIKEQLLAAFDDWAYVAWKRKDEDLHRLLLIIARRADPDPWKNRLRDPDLWNSSQGLDQLAGQALADKALLARLSPQMLQHLGVLLGETGGKRDVPWLRQAQALHPADFWLNLNLGKALGKADPQQAEGYVRAAVAVRSDSTAGWYNLGYVLHRQKNYKEAVGDLEKALHIDPLFVQAWILLGNVRLDQGETSQAIKHFEKAIELDNTNPLAWFNFGNVFLRQKDYAKAARHYHTAIGLDRNFAPSWHALGEALENQREFQQAVEAFQKASQLDRRNSSTWYHLGIVLHNQKNLEAAAAAYRTAVELDPKNALAWFNLGNTQAARKDWPAAGASYRKALQVDPKHAVAWNNLGLVLREQKNTEQAASAFRKAIAADPNYADPHESLGAILQGQGKYAEAAVQYRQFLKIAPPQHLRRAAIAVQAEQCEQRAIKDRLPKVLAGQQTTAAEQLALAELCATYAKRYRDAVRLYAGAFLDQPGLAEDLRDGYRYRASRAALLASAGKGEGTGPLNEAEKTRLRRQALTWLQAELQACKELLQDAVPTLTDCQRQLDLWRRDPDLAPVREPKQLAELPAGERKAWQELWAEVDRVLQQISQVQQQSKEEKPKPSAIQAREK